MSDIYEVYAIRYARRDAKRTEHFIGGDPHDAPMHMDYYVWLVRNARRTFVVDIGFSREMAAKRKREYLRTPAEGLAMLGVDAASVEDVIISHMHYDHAGTQEDFPKARFHLQESEMQFITGRYMKHARLRHSFPVEDVCGMVRALYDGRVEFANGMREIAPGLSVHHIGGHTMGIQCVRVKTQRGWVVLASDTSHYYEHMQNGRVFVTMFSVGDALEGYGKLVALADSPDHVIPGHDPLVLARYPAPGRELEGIVARLDVPPRQ